MEPRWVVKRKIEICGNVDFVSAHRHRATTKLPDGVVAKSTWKTKMRFPNNTILSAVVALATSGILPCGSAAHERTSATPAEPLRVFSLPGATLTQLRRDIAAGKMSDPALQQLRKDADGALAQEPLSVTQKSEAPPSGDKHDYMSQAPYWWPDPAKSNGLPYIRRDGETNPDIERLPDHKNLSRLISTTHTLALAYFLLGDEKCAARASELLRVWFLDPETRMTPNLQYAQSVPGRNTGRGIGLIETRGVFRLVDTVGLLRDSKAWSKKDQEGMENWCGKFLDWMLESENGKDEAAAKNNHGTYYDVQIASLALFTGRVDLARNVLETARTKRLAAQIAPDGKQPLELARTKALGYSTMNLAGLCELALLGEKTGVDLWNYQTSDGRSVRKALDFLIPYVAGEKKWPYKQIVDYKPNEISPILILAATKYKQPGYGELALKVDPDVARNIEVLPFRTLRGKN